MKTRAMILALCVAACGQANTAKAPEEPQAPDPYVLSIEAGRYSYMLHQVETLTAERPGASELDTGDPRSLTRNLRELVWSYNLERSRLCSRNLFTELSCGPVYDPVWTSEPAETAPTIEEIQARSDAVGEEVMRFWDAVCTDARSRAADEAARREICAIE